MRALPPCDLGRHRGQGTGPAGPGRRLDARRPAASAAAGLACLLAGSVAGACGVVGVLVLREPVLPTLKIDYPIDVAALRAQGCPDSEVQQSDGETVHVLRITPEAEGCHIVREDLGVPVLSGEAVAEAVGEGRLAALRRASLLLQEAVLLGPEAQVLPLEETLARLEVEVAGTPLLGLDAIRALPNGEVALPVPEPLWRGAAEAIREGGTLRTDLRVDLLLPFEALDALPETVRLHLRLQPEVAVDVFEALQSGATTPAAE